ncbi:MAG: cellulase family glycosylhydrolase [Capsulimonadaceae bacterium]|nr:cellulase family glycosylhydrolase [Capsulimonadaceae bacterium]
MRTFIVFALGLICLAATTVFARADDAKLPSMFPFVIPWDDATPGTAVDVSYLNAKPAGVNGFIVVKDGRFVEAKTGKRIRFMATNFTFASDFPSHEDADKVAAHLAKLGINLVRIHHHDIDHSPLWDKSTGGHTKFDPVAVDKLDYLLAQFKKNGIYVDLNLHVSRKFTAADGFPASVNDITDVEFDKRIDNLDRRMIDLQKQFAKDYLTRVNPYTGLSYVNDPAVAIIEINNENTLAGWPTESPNQFFDKLPEPFRGEVVRLWNDYLLRKYRTTAVLRKAWVKAPAAAATGPVDLLGSNLKWRVEDRVGDVKLTTVGPGTTSTMPAVDIVNPGPTEQAWWKQLHVTGLNLNEGGVYMLSLRAKSDREQVVQAYTSLDQDDWHHLGLDASLKVGPDWHTFRYVFQAVRTMPGHARLSFILGTSAGELSLADVKLSRTTSDDVLDKGQSLEAHNLDFPMLTTNEQRSDWRKFLVDTELAYVNEMRAYLRNDLKVHGNIVDTQMSYGDPAGFLREADSDFIDNHAYWQHPHFPGRPWDPVNWLVPNSPMTDDLVKGNGGNFAHLACERMAGKPYTVSEYNHPAPSDYQAEMYPEVASYAAAQDWDAIFQFDYGNYGTGRTLDRIQGFFTMQGNPAKEAFVPAAALIFRQGLIAPLSSKATLHVPASFPYGIDMTTELWRKASDGKLPDLTANRIATVVDRTVTAPKLVRSTGPASATSVKAVSSPAGSQYLAVGSAASAAAGFFGGEQVDLGTAKLTFPEFGNNFAALTLTTLDAKPLGQSSHLLLTITGKAENLGMVWNADRTSVGRNWGRGPVQAEGIPATVTLANASVKHVWALDPTGARVKEVPVTVSGGKASFTIGPDYRTVWYEIGE